MREYTFKRVITAFVFCFLMNFSFGQKISQELEKRIDFIYELSNINLNQALLESYKLQEKMDNFNPFDQVTIYLVVIDLQKANDKTEAAIVNCERALKISEENHFDNYTLNIYYYLAKAYVEQNRVENALDIYNNLSIKMDKADLFYMYNLMQIDFALLHKDFNNYNKAISIYKNLNSGNSAMFKDDTEQHYDLLLNLAELYNSIGYVDSSNVYLDKFKNLYTENPDIKNYNWNKVKGNIAFDNQEYKTAIEYYNRYITLLKEIIDYNDLEVVLKKGQSFFNLKELDSAIFYSEIIDTSNFEDKLSKKNLANFYKLKSDILKLKNNSDESDLYFNRYLKAKEGFNALRFKTQEGLNDIKTKEILAEGERNENVYKEYIAYISSILGFLLAAGLMLYIFNYQKNKKKFAQLMSTVRTYEEKKSIEPENKKVSIVEELPLNIKKEHIKNEEAKKQLVEVVEENEAEQIELQSNKVRSTIDEDSTSPIKDEKIHELLDKLDKLKDSGYFLRQDSSLYNTAKKLKTNTSYLSSVINNTMDTNFNRFVNDIRMDYIILELKNNKRMRSYSVKGIAEEIGYKSADSFSKYFKESTGLTPSAYVRNLNKEFKV
ncbi:helix-turn-helix domain-containing protein [Zobellia barbeyronii]|uniref:AraC family transcriptional regulator n=1 Tax=Zobellia barbeyronii TaxID=2748009 RepID=A0ABS5WAU6_9FLAO|nr:helix-turn-helix domain-containing protein [Zobellia barbeyronii]MBT2160504.1 AraC family transcriptional regulator [Zobellia barbeyronii]